MGVPCSRLSVCWIELSLITSILSLSAKLEKAVVDIIRSVKNVHGYWDLVREIKVCPTFCAAAEQLYPEADHPRMLADGDDPDPPGDHPRPQQDLHLAVGGPPRTCPG